MRVSPQTLPPFLLVYSSSYFIPATLFLLFHSGSSSPALTASPSLCCRKRAESEARKGSLPNSKELPLHHPTDPVELRRLNFQTPGRCSCKPLPSPNPTRPPPPPSPLPGRRAGRGWTGAQRAARGRIASIKEVPRSRKHNGGRHNSIYHLGRRGHAWARLPPKLTAARRLDEGGI